MPSKKYYSQKVYLPDLWSRSIWKNYIQTVLKQLDHLAIWEPTTALHLGDYGTLDSNYRWDYQGNLFDNYEIPIKSREHHKRNTQIFDDNGSVSVMIAGKGKIPEIANGGVKLQFEKKSQVGFVLFDTIQYSISNIAAITKAIVELAKNDKWRPDYHVITNVWKAEKLIFISSKTKNNTVFVEANVEVSQSQLGGAEIKFEIKDTRKTEYQFIADRGATPLYQLHHLRSNRDWSKFSLVRTTPWVF